MSLNLKSCMSATTGDRKLVNTHDLIINILFVLSVHTLKHTRAILESAYFLYLFLAFVVS